MNDLARGLFITGTDTEVGKTYVAALIARDLVGAGHRVGVYKPVASGCRLEAEQLVADDAVALWEAAGRPDDLDRVCPQRFLAPLAPHLAAKEEGKTLDIQLMVDGLDYWTERSDIVVVEGVGGLMSPLSEDAYVADLAEEFSFPLVVVSKNVLGTISQTLQTLITAAAFSNELPIVGVVLNNPAPPSNDPSRNSNRAELAARCIPPVLAEVAWQADHFDPAVDWYALAKKRGHSTFTKK